MPLSQTNSLGEKNRKRERIGKDKNRREKDGKRPVGRPSTRWTNFIENLGWNRLGLYPSEMMEVMKNRELWRLNFELLPPHGKAGNEEAVLSLVPSFQPIVWLPTVFARYNVEQHKRLLHIHEKKFLLYFKLAINLVL